MQVWEITDLKLNEKSAWPAILEIQIINIHAVLWGFQLIFLDKNYTNTYWNIEWFTRRFSWIKSIKIFTEILSKLSEDFFTSRCIQGNLHQILVESINIRLYLSFSDWFVTKWSSIRFKIIITKPWKPFLPSDRILLIGNIIKITNSNLNCVSKEKYLLTKPKLQQTNNKILNKQQRKVHILKTIKP